MLIYPLVQCCPFIDIVVYYWYYIGNALIGIILVIMLILLCIIGIILPLYCHRIIGIVFWYCIAHWYIIGRFILLVLFVVAHGCNYNYWYSNPHSKSKLCQCN